MPDYSRFGKIEQPLTEDEFQEGMDHGHFVEPRHRAYVVLLYYSAVRKREGWRVIREQFRVLKDKIIFDVGERLKHSKKTPALPLPLDAPYMNELKEAIEKTAPGNRVFPFSYKTAYNIVRRAFKYPHLFRLSRITNFFLDGWTIPEVRSWTGLSLKALDSYVGLVGVARMGESLAHRT